jgi:hypothetical protein
MLCASPLTARNTAPHDAHRGLVHLALGSLEAAEADFQDALRSNPTHAHYPHYRAVVHGRKVSWVQVLPSDRTWLSDRLYDWCRVLVSGMQTYLPVSHSGARKTS